MEKQNKLILNQETLRCLNQDVHHNNGPRFATQVFALCNTKAVSCPECNPPRARQE
jgi:hypothetical protein